MLNFAVVNAELLPFVSDAASAKQEKFMPGSHIPILPPSALVKFNPDFVLKDSEFRDNIGGKETSIYYPGDYPELRVYFTNCNFINNFGTHAIKQVMMGAKFMARASVKKDLLEKFNQEGHTVSFSGEASGWMIKAGGSYSKSD